MCKTVRCICKYLQFIDRISWLRNYKLGYRIESFRVADWKNYKLKNNVKMTSVEKSKIIDEIFGFDEHLLKFAKLFRNTSKLSSIIKTCSIYFFGEKCKKIVKLFWYDEFGVIRKRILSAFHCCIAISASVGMKWANGSASYIRRNQNLDHTICRLFSKL